MPLSSDLDAMAPKKEKPISLYGGELEAHANSETAKRIDVNAPTNVKTEKPPARTRTPKQVKTKATPKRAQKMAEEIQLSPGNINTTLAPPAPETPSSSRTNMASGEPISLRNNIYLRTHCVQSR